MLLGQGSGTPSWDPRGPGPPGPRRGGRGKFPGPGRAGPRAPGAPPGDPAGDPSGTPVWGPILGPVWGPYIYIFIVLDPPSGGPIWGALCAPPGGPRGAPRPGGQKSAHFFGYLITLPVGTVWALFFPPRDRAVSGTVWGIAGWVSVYRTYGTMRSMRCRAGPLGRRASDGYPLAGLTANGWYVPSGRDPPSRQGRKSAQDREVAGRRRPFARAKRGPTTGVTGKVRKCLAEQVVPYQ